MCSNSWGLYHPVPVSGELLLKGCLEWRLSPSSQIASFGFFFAACSILLIPSEAVLIWTTDNFSQLLLRSSGEINICWNQFPWEQPELWRIYLNYQFFLSQDEKNQLLTTNVWLNLVYNIAINYEYENRKNYLSRIFIMMTTWRSWWWWITILMMMMMMLNDKSLPGMGGCQHALEWVRVRQREGHPGIKALATLSTLLCID